MFSITKKTLYTFKPSDPDSELFRIITKYFMDNHDVKYLNYNELLEKFVFIYHDINAEDIDCYESDRQDWENIVYLITGTAYYCETISTSIYTEKDTDTLTIMLSDKETIKNE